MKKPRIPATPDRVEGYTFNEVEGCNWRKCWAVFEPTDKSPFVIQLRDYSLWVVPHDMPVGTWGSHYDGTPKHRPDTSVFLGPFETFDEAFATFVLMVTE